MKAISSHGVKHKIKITMYLSLVWLIISFILAFYEKEIVQVFLFKHHYRGCDHRFLKSLEQL